MSENMRKSWSSSLPILMAICSIFFFLFLPTEDVVGLQPRHTLQTIRIISSSVPLGLFDTISPRWENENAKTNDRWGHIVGSVSRLGEPTTKTLINYDIQVHSLGRQPRTNLRGTENDCLCVKFPIHVGKLCSGSNFNIYLQIIQVSCSRAWKVDRKSLYALYFCKRENWKNLFMRLWRLPHYFLPQIGLVVLLWIMLSWESFPRSSEKGHFGSEREEIGV